LRLGVSYEAQDFEGNKPLDFAKEKGYQELVNLITTHQLTIIKRK
jgi:hypothetical protein